MKKIHLLIFFVIFFSGASVVKAEDYHDLYVERISLNPTAPAANQTCQIEVLVKNKGTVNIFSNSGLNYVDYEFDDFVKQKEEFPNPTLNDFVVPGGYLVYTFEGYFKSEGEKDIFFEIDSKDYLNEEDEDNNEINTSVNIKLSDKVDISVYDIDFSDNDVLINEDVDITVKVKNTGEVSLTDLKGLNRDDFYFLSPNFNVTGLDINRVPSLEDPFNPGDIYEYVYSGQFFKSGINTISFEIDDNNYLKETNEENNLKSVNFQVYLNKEERDDFDIYDTDIDIISSSTVEISWKTTKEANTIVKYRKNIHTDYLQATGNGTPLEHSVKISSLAPDTKYVYKVVSENGTVVKSSDYFDFTTPANDNVKALLDPGMSNDSDSGNPVITWMTNLISDSKVYYKLSDDSDYQLKSSSSLTDKHIVDLGDLDPGLYHYYVVSNSSVGTSYQSSLDSFLLKSNSSATEETTTNNTEAVVNNNTSETNTNAQTSAAESNVAAETDISNTNLYNSLKGKIILQVEASGEAYYIHPDNQKMYYLGRPDDAFNVMRELGLGISEANYNSFNGVAPSNLRGKILLRVEANGEAYYVNPVDLKMHYLGRPADAFNVMRELGLGISNSNFESL